MKKQLKEFAGTFKDVKVVIGAILALGIIASNIVDFSKIPQRLTGIEDCIAEDAAALKDETVAREKEDVSINHSVDKLAINIDMYIKQNTENRLEHQSQHTESMNTMLRYIDAKTE